MCVSVYICMRQGPVAWNSPGDGVTDGCEPCDIGPEPPNSGILEEQKICITTEPKPPLWPRVFFAAFISRLLPPWLVSDSFPTLCSPFFSLPHPSFHQSPTSSLVTPVLQLVPPSFLAMVHDALTIPRVFTTCPPGPFALISNRHVYLILGVPKTVFTACPQGLSWVFLGPQRPFQASPSRSSFPSHFCF